MGTFKAEKSDKFGTDSVGGTHKISKYSIQKTNFLSRVTYIVINSNISPLLGDKATVKF